MRMFFLIILFGLLAGCGENYHKTKTYVQKENEGRFSVGDCRVSFLLTPTRDTTKPNKMHFSEPFWLRLVLVIDETSDMEPPLLVTSYELVTPTGERLDLLEGEKFLEFDLRKGRRLESHSHPGEYRRVTHYDIKDLPFSFDEKTPISIDIELSFGNDKVKKTIKFKPEIRSRPKTPLDVFDSV